METTKAEFLEAKRAMDEWGDRRAMLDERLQKAGIVGDQVAAILAEVIAYVEEYDEAHKEAPADGAVALSAGLSCHNPNGA